MNAFSADFLAHDRLAGFEREASGSRRARLAEHPARERRALGTRLVTSLRGTGRKAVDRPAGARAA